LPELPHFRAPFSLSGGSFAAVEQDSPEEIAQCVEAVCKTFVGSRIDAPDYGIRDETFTTQTPSPSVAAVVAAVEEAEPRAHVLGTGVVEGMVRRIVLRVRGEA